MKRRAASKKRNKALHNIAKLVECFHPEEESTYYKKFFNFFKKIINFEHASIFFMDETKNKLVEIASTGKSVNLVDDFTFDLGNGLTAWNAKRKKVLIINNYESKEIKELKISSFLSIPLVIESKLFAVINFCHHLPNVFQNSQIKQLELYAPLLAAVLSKNSFIQKLKKQKDETELMHKKLIETQQQLRLAEKKAAVSATICSLNHEINNPLMIISGYIQLLESTVTGENVVDKNKVKEKFKNLNEQIERISDIMKKLRDIENPDFENYINDGKIDKMLIIPKQ